MNNHRNFEFGNQSVADAYDDLLVPLMFEPWAQSLLDGHPTWQGKRVLDLAAGTGVVTRLLADRVGNHGTIVALDVNPQMLAVARRRLGDNPGNVAFVESPAHPMGLPPESVDVVVCQQGFQFFPDRAAAAAEIHRVLAPHGKAIVSTWLPVSRCHVFGVICDVLDELGQPETAQAMRVPFDFIDAAELRSNFRNAGFASATVTQTTQPFMIPGGFDHAVDVAYATPIGPALRALPEQEQQQFRTRMTARLDQITDDGVTMGELAANILVAEK